MYKFFSRVLGLNGLEADEADETDDEVYVAIDDGVAGKAHIYSPLKKKREALQVLPVQSLSPLEINQLFNNLEEPDADRLFTPFYASMGRPIKAGPTAAWLSSDIVDGYFSAIDKKGTNILSLWGKEYIKRVFRRQAIWKMIESD